MEGEASLTVEPKGHHYDATSIQILEGLDAVRKRPAMYIGDVGMRGLHGVGVSVVNALSEWCEVEVLKNGRIYTQRYETGKPTGPMKTSEATGAAAKKGSGTTTRFKPDAKIFADVTLHWDTLAGRLREL